MLLALTRLPPLNAKLFSWAVRPRTSSGDHLSLPAMTLFGDSLMNMNIVEAQ